MHDAQIFQLIGLTYLCAGLGLLIHPKFQKNMLDGFVTNAGLVYSIAFPTLLVGFLLVAYHNDWHAKWTVIVTIIGWIALLKGITMFVLPELYQAVAAKLENKTAILRTMAAVITIIGAALLFIGLYVLPVMPD